jgi:hypothetical protein
MLMFDPQTAKEKPAWLEVAEKDETVRPRAKPMTDAEQRRMAPILGHVATGDLPLDIETKRAVKRYLAAVHSQAVRGDHSDGG